jgi:hypothetical protein
MRPARQQAGRQRIGRQAEGEPARGIEADQPLVPAGVGAHELPDAEGIEEFVGDEERRPRPDVVEAVVPLDRHAGAGQGRFLALPQHGAGLDQGDANGVQEPRHDACGAQKIGHQRAAPRSQLDEPQRRRRTHRLPGGGAPHADQFAEHLRDLRRRGEIAGAAERVLAHVVAMAGMAEAQAHVAVDADRPLGRDHRHKLALEAHRAACARAMSQTPAANSGSDSTMPSVSQPPAR